MNQGSKDESTIMSPNFERKKKGKILSRLDYDYFHHEISRFVGASSPSILAIISRATFCRISCGSISGFFKASIIFSFSSSDIGSISGYKRELLLSVIASTSCIYQPAVLQFRYSCSCFSTFFFPHRYQPVWDM